SPNREVDADITEAGVYGALYKHHTTCAPGPNRVPNKLIRNVDALSVTALSSLLKDCWRVGSII
ncbi:hypothetical protein MTO96_045801, partial [Rhipicephalus appendiculatus]